MTKLLSARLAASKSARRTLTRWSLMQRQQRPQRAKSKSARRLTPIDAQHRRQVAEAITEATQRLRKDKKALQDEIARIKANAETPDLTALSETVRKMLGLKKLGEEQWRLIAQILGKAISVGGKSYDPISKEQLLRNEENLRITSGVTHALETLSGAPSADVMKAAAWPVQRKQHLRVLNGVIKWCTEYRAALGKG